jgi:osmoprotectant transport system ATP-binding protein
VELTSGEIFLRGKNILDGDPVKLRRSLGYVIQSIGLLPHRTIAQNIATVPSLLGWEEDRVQGRVDELVELLELDPVMLGRYPSELSGGQLQRVGVARAIAADPPVMLMDEPFGAVDPIVRGRLQDEFMDLQDRLKKTIIFVTHDIDEAIKMADRIAILNVGGVLEQYDSPEQILSEPATGFVERFVGFERGLKRLSLRKVADIPVEDGPIVRVGDSAESARAELARTEFDWVAVLDGRRVLGWIDEEALGESRVVTPELASRFVAGVTPKSSLREAIDTIVRSRTNVAVVTDEDNNYIGILTQEHISKEIIV